MLHKFIFITILLLGLACNTNPQTTNSVTKTDVPRMKGLNFVAVPDPFTINPMTAVTAVNADWIAIIPYGFTMLGKPFVKYNTNGGQWWGERPEGVAKTIELAHEAHIHTLLKPQVYVPDGFTGNLDYSTEADWQLWEQDYERFILFFADIAAKNKVEMLCIGTEFKTSVMKHPDFWQKLIVKIRSQYSGKLIYAANWDEYENVPFWNDLDYVGVNAYFPLSKEQNPSSSNLQKAWLAPIAKLKAFAEKSKKQIVFTEYGYMSVGGCADASWEIEAKKDELSINEKAQAEALDALLTSFGKESWWQGGFLWKWFPNMEGHEGYPEKDYTPQGKKAEQVLCKWYKKL